MFNFVKDEHRRSCTTVFARCACMIGGQISIMHGHVIQYSVVRCALQCQPPPENCKNKKHPDTDNV